jgi:hypothetical protein
MSFLVGSLHLTQFHPYTIFLRNGTSMMGTNCLYTFFFFCITPSHHTLSGMNLWGRGGEKDKNEKKNSLCLSVIMVSRNIL